ncbi:hypothetical protein QQY66_27060 [Streptomyces sp. DG2A-72]|uniref:hypothetical protein n=1 Tax=Streptomyces sp. DG2A-72 TaxID=3051386 RepID=UPI00265C1628|nr:hypothetical protein [Streptomyces sp. DG2A-72]MDO0935151.1 hypothetical protein [Streptomyces sp. DG2A-72]
MVSPAAAGPGRMVLRHPARYLGRFGFGAFHVLFLPVLVTSTTLNTLYTGQVQ